MTDMLLDTPYFELRGEVSTFEEDDVFVTLKGWLTADLDHSDPWRKRARENYDFYAGRQWLDTDQAKLDNEGRPCIVFNRVISIVKAICGLEINSRHDTVFIPREQDEGEIKANEILTAGSDWMADGCDAEDEQSEAFQDCVITGMGWTEAIVEYDEEPDGMYVERKMDPLEMVWDKHARSKNLSDAKHLFRVRSIPLKDARDMFPEAPDADLDASWANLNQIERAKPIEERRKKTENSSHHDTRAEVTIVHAMWIEMEDYYRISDPVTQSELKLNEEEFTQYKQIAEEHGFVFKSAKQKRKVYKQAFLGGKMLSEVEELPCKDHFPWNCITGERDSNKGTWFGLIDIMKDPQMWANKWLSQTLHILDTTAKGGILAETGAFPDIREAQRTYAKANSITEVSDGAIANQKIMQKPGTGITAPFVQLLEFAISSIRDTSGVSLEMLGMRDATQPGILEHQRKQAGMTILATLFDSLRKFRKRVARVRLYYLQEYFSDGRLIRVYGEDGMQSMRLLKDRTMGKFDIEIDEAPTSPNKREQTWVVIQQILPAFKELLTPESVIAILEYSPLPTKLVNTFKQIANKPSPEQDEAKEIAKAEKVADIQATRAQAAKSTADAARSKVQAILDLANAGVQVTQAEQNRIKSAAIKQEMTLEDVLAQLRGIVADPVQDQGSQLPFPPQVPTQPIQVQPDMLPVNGGDPTEGFLAT